VASWSQEPIGTELQSCQSAWHHSWMCNVCAIQCSILSIFGSQPHLNKIHGNHSILTNSGHDQARQAGSSSTATGGNGSSSIMSFMARRCSRGRARCRKARSLQHPRTPHVILKLQLEQSCLVPLPQSEIRYYQASRLWCLVLPLTWNLQRKQSQSIRIILYVCHQRPNLNPPFFRGLKPHTAEGDPEMTWQFNVFSRLGILQK
jgi:hypothetical protein